MRRRPGSIRDSLIVLAVVVVLGAGILCFGLSVEDDGLVLSGWIVLGAAAVIVVAHVVVVARVAALRARLPQLPPGSVVFLASVMATDATWLRGHGRLGVAVADADGIEVLRGRPPRAEWVAAWAEVAELETGSVNVGRQFAPVIHVRFVDGTDARLLLHGDHGLYPSPDYARALLEELQALRGAV